MPPPCRHHADLELECFPPAPTQLAEFDVLWAALDPGIQTEIASSFGQPRRTP